MSIRSSLAIAASLSALAGCGDGSAPSAPSAAIGGIEVSFKVDPRIARGLYMGDRWITAPYLRVGDGAQVTVEARAYVLDTAGQPTTIAPAWRSSDPGMVTVTPATGNEVNLTVTRPGESRVQITAPGASAELAIRAACPNGVIQMEISQIQ